MLTVSAVAYSPPYEVAKERIIQPNPREKLSPQSSGSLSICEERAGYSAA